MEFLDSSNHKYMKMFPILIHYFTENDGSQVKLLDLQTLPNETLDKITVFCIKALKNYNIPVKDLVAFETDNTNTNIG